MPGSVLSLALVCRWVVGSAFNALPPLLFALKACPRHVRPAGVLGTSHRQLLTAGGAAERLLMSRGVLHKGPVPCVVCDLLCCPRERAQPLPAPHVGPGLRRSSTGAQNRGELPGPMTQGYATGTLPRSAAPQ